MEKTYEEIVAERDSLKAEVEMLEEKIEIMAGSPGDYAELVMLWQDQRLEIEKLRGLLISIVKEQSIPNFERNVRIARKEILGHE